MMEETRLEDQPYEPIRISWSSLKVHQTCHQKSYLHRTGHRSPVADKRNFIHGTAVDRVMRAWLEAPEQVPGAMVGMVEEILEREVQETIDSGEGVVNWRDGGDKKRVIAWCKTLVERLEPCLATLVLPYEYEVAKRFVVPVELPYSEDEYREVHLVGEIDLLVKEDENVFDVWDLKATENSKYWLGTAGQLMFYDLVVQIMFNIDKCKYTGLIQPMVENNPVLYFDFGDDDYRQMWGRIHRYATDVWRGNVKPKKSYKGCDWCDVKHACAKMRPVNGKMTFGGINIKDVL